MDLLHGIWWQVDDPACVSALQSRAKSGHFRFDGLFRDVLSFVVVHVEPEVIRPCVVLVCFVCAVTRFQVEPAFIAVWFTSEVSEFSNDFRHCHSYSRWRSGVLSLLIHDKHFIPDLQVCEFVCLFHGRSHLGLICEFFRCGFTGAPETHHVRYASDLVLVLRLV
jgi:hypothetical protein